MALYNPPRINSTVFNSALFKQYSVLPNPGTSFVGSGSTTSIQDMSLYLLISVANSSYATKGEFNTLKSSVGLSTDTTESTLWGKANVIKDSLSSYLLTTTANATYATISALTTVSNSLSSYLTTASAASIYQTIAGMSDYVTQNYATVNLVPKASLSAYALKINYMTSADVNATFLQNDALDNYSTTAQIASTYVPLTTLASYITTVAADLKYALKTDVVATDLSNYYTKTASDNLFYSKAASDAKYALISSLNNYQTISGMSSYQTIAGMLGNYQLISGMGNYMLQSVADAKYALITSLPNMSLYLTSAQISASYATITSLSSYITTVAGDAKYALISSLPDLAAYYTKPQADAKFALITSLPDLSSYYTKAVIDVTFYTMTASDLKYALKTAIVNFVSKETILSDINSKNPNFLPISSLVNTLAAANEIIIANGENNKLPGWEISDTRLRICRYGATGFYLTPTPPEKPFTVLLLRGIGVEQNSVRQKYSNLSTMTNYVFKFISAAKDATVAARPHSRLRLLDGTGTTMLKETLFRDYGTSNFANANWSQRELAFILSDYVGVTEVYVEIKNMGPDVDNGATAGGDTYIGVSKGYLTYA